MRYKMQPGNFFSRQYASIYKAQNY
uniref:Uncharacterized protein n=1 Tax=Anguilla anguilla TaxID=7936 RepID=A0A0E9SNJ1_ANGAN